MLRLLDAYLGRTRPADTSTWHRWRAWSMVRLIDGTTSREHGQLWRRWYDGRWEYRQDDETLDEFQERVW